MGQAPTDADVARRRGRRAGSTSDGFGGSCPYGHAAIHLRRAWFKGFGEGRADLRAQLGAGKDAASRAD